MLAARRTAAILAAANHTFGCGQVNQHVTTVRRICKKHTAYITHKGLEQPIIFLVVGTKEKESITVINLWLNSS